MIKPGAFFGGSSLARSLVVLIGNWKDVYIQFLVPNSSSSLPLGADSQKMMRKFPLEGPWPPFFIGRFPRLVGDSHPFFSCIMIWSRHPIETLQPFFWLIRGYPMGTHWFWDPISSPKKTRPKFLLRFWGLSKSEETPAFLPFTSCNANAKMRDSTWDSAASQCRRVYFETDLNFPMPNFHFHSELYNWKGSWEDKHTKCHVFDKRSCLFKKSLRWGLKMAT